MNLEDFNPKHSHPISQPIPQTESTKMSFAGAGNNLCGSGIIRPLKPATPQEGVSATVPQGDYSIGKTLPDGTVTIHDVEGDNIADACHMVYAEIIVEALNRPTPAPVPQSDGSCKCGRVIRTNQAQCEVCEAVQQTDGVMTPTDELVLNNFFEEWAKLPPQLPLDKDGDGEYEASTTKMMYACFEYAYKKGMWGAARHINSDMIAQICEKDALLAQAAQQKNKEWQEILDKQIFAAAQGHEVLLKVEHRLLKASAELEALRRDKAELVSGLQDLLKDTQHKDHDCGETDDRYCPVLWAKNLITKHGEQKHD